MDQDQQFAVLTGDIVASSRIRGVGENRLVSWILDAEKRVSDCLPGAVHGKVDIFRGDSWQMVLLEPAVALRAALLFRSALISSAGIDTRLAVGIGRADYLPQENVSTGTGEAFMLSGMGLAALVKPVRMRLAFNPQHQSSLSEALNVIISLIDLQVQSWTRKQAGAVAGALAGLTQQQIANGWKTAPISQQAVSQHLENAGWSQLDASLVFFEMTIPEIISGEN